MSIINALFINMGKVIPYFKMTPELAQDLHSTLAKVMMYAKSKGIKLSQKQQDYIMNQTKQLDMYEKSLTPAVPKGPKAEVIDLSKKLPESAPYSEKNPKGWMPTEAESKGIMENVDFNEDLVSSAIENLKGKTDAKSFQDEIKKIIGRKGTYADYSDAEIKGVLDGIEADTKKQIKSAEDIMGEGDFDPSGMKDGGRIGFNVGGFGKMIDFILKHKNIVNELFSVTPEQLTREVLEKAAKQNQKGLYKLYNSMLDKVEEMKSTGIESLKENINKRFGKGAITTADDVTRPESAITRDLFKQMSDKLKNKLPEKAGQGRFTKAEAIIARLQNTINDIKPGDEDYEYVSKTFPNWIKEIQAKPSLAENENVWKKLAVEGLPENQRLKVYEDGTVDFQTLKPTHTFKLKEDIKRKLNASGGLNYLMGI
jgi:hypothetical protein